MANMVFRLGIWLLGSMTAGRFINGWALIVVLLVVIIVAGSIVAWSRYSRSQAIEITIVPDGEFRGEIYVGGEVNNPGFYPLETGESVEDIIRAAGGNTNGADLNQLKLFVPSVAEGELPQKVNINRAEAWLLEALPGIGEVRAKAIIDYRQQNGPFRSIHELIKVDGIGTTAYEKIKHLITVAE
jgi:competence protein ComEA